VEARQRSELMADLQSYLKSRKGDAIPTRPGRNGGSQPASVSDSPSPLSVERGVTHRDPVQEAILDLLTAHPMSPQEIAKEVKKRKQLSVSIRKVGMMVHDLAEQGRLRMVGPSMYARAN
jgi:hypothetical protein